MEVTQAFRPAGKTDTIEILCDHIDGQYVIHWVDIQEAFPAVKHIKKGNIFVNRMKDSEYNTIVPHRIKHHSGVVLDVVLMDDNSQSTSSQSSGTVSVTTDVCPQQATQLLEDTPLGDGMDIDRMSTLQLTDAQEDTEALLSSRQVVKRAQDRGALSEYELQLMSCLPTNLQSEVMASSNVRGTLVQAIKDTLALSNQPNEQLITVLQDFQNSVTRSNELASKNNDMALEQKQMMKTILDLQENLKAKQDEFKQLQKQALDRLAHLQNGVEAILTQTYELHEYPIPRLFIVLPQVGSSRDPLDFFANKFRLYFLCECDCEGSTKDEIHLALHRGYDIVQPKEFFRKYGPYVLTILNMLKFGISAAGMAVPALSHLVMDGVDQVTESLKLMDKTIEPGMNYVIDYIEKNMVKEGDAVSGYAEQIGGSEALEGADLRQLESLLKIKDENRVLGNLYRTVTTKGHVKWVCITHYRKNYQEQVAKRLRDTVDLLGGSFDENTGRVKVILPSKIQAEQFYQALENTRSVFVLCIVLDWKTTPNDFKRLRDALVKTNVGMLEIDLAYQEGDILSRVSKRYDPLFDIMRHLSMKSIAIFRPHDGFVQQLPRKGDFANLKRLEISLSDRYWDPDGVKRLVTKLPNLSDLVLSDSRTHLLLPVYFAIAGRQTYPITVNSFPVPIPPPKGIRNQSMTPLQCITHLLKVNDGWIDNLEWSEQEDAVVEAFVKATKSGLKLRGLTIVSTDQVQSDSNIKNVASIVACSELQRLEIALKGDEKRMRILESIQWEHLCELMLTTEKDSLLTSMKTLLNGRTKMSGKVLLEEFRLYHDSNDLLTEAIGETLQAFIASTTLIELQLEVDMAFEQLHYLVKSVDVSRLVVLSLRAKGIRSTEVDTLLDGLQDAKLLILSLRGSKITKEQKERMEAKGTSLSS